MELSPSVLQQKYPLSSRKFWKKILTKIFAFFFFSLLIGFFTSLTLSSFFSAGMTVTIFMLTFFGLFLLITFFYSWYVKVYIKRYYYEGGDSFITIKKGVFAPAEIHVQWQKIQDVYVDQDILDRVMGLYDVHIASATATSGMEAHIDGVDAAGAEGLKKFFLDKLSNGGRNNAAATTGGDAELVPKVPTINLIEEISNKIYPLKGKWIALKLVNRIISPFVYWAALMFFLFAKSNGDADFFSFSISTYILLYLIASILSAIIHSIAFMIWTKNYTFNFTKENIYFRQGVISISEKHMPYSSIQDVTVRQGIIERFLGLGSVVIENAAQQIVTTKGVIFTGVVIQGISIEDANKITNILKSTVIGKSNSQYGL